MIDAGRSRRRAGQWAEAAFGGGRGIGGRFPRARISLGVADGPDKEVRAQLGDALTGTVPRIGPVGSGTTEVVRKGAKPK